MDWNKIRKAIKKVIEEDIKGKFSSLKSKRKKKKPISEYKGVRLIKAGGAIGFGAIGGSSFVWTILYAFNQVPQVSFQSANLIVGGVFLLPVAVIWNWFWKKVEIRLKPPETHEAESIPYSGDAGGVGG